MSANGYYRVALTGGGSTALDGIDGDLLNDGDMAMCSVSGVYYVYLLDASNSGSESTPYLIAPDTNPGTKRWVQMQQPWASANGSLYLTSNLVKNPQRMPWNVGNEGYVGLGYPATSSTYHLTQARMLNTSAAWTILAGAGDTAQVTTDDTLVTVTSVSSGSGVLTNLFLPGVTSISDVVTVVITVDGVEHTLSFTAEAATDRFFVGLVEQMSDTTSYSVDAGTHFMWQDASYTTGALRRNDSLLYNMVSDPNHTLSNSQCLRFETSLVIEMKSSDVSTTNSRDYCGAVYTLDQ